MSLFATALISLLDDTKVFTRLEWARLLMVPVERIQKWLDDEEIPRASHLNMVLTTLEILSDIPAEPVRAFKEMAQKPAREVSPLGSLMLPTVWEYMKRLIFSELSNELAKLSLEQRRARLEELFPA